MKKITAIIIAAVVLALALALTAVFLLKPKSSKTTGNLSLKTAALGEETGIFAEGKNIEDISIFEINLEPNPQGSKIISAEPGGFFGENPLKVKWEIEKGYFILIKNPKSKDSKNVPDEPILTVKLDSGTFSISPESRAYLKGGRLIYVK